MTVLMAVTFDTNTVAELIKTSSLANPSTYSPTPDAMRRHLPSRLQCQRHELVDSDQNNKESQRGVGMGMDMFELFITILSGELS